MKRICAWCQKNLGPSNLPEENADFPITHGICGDCMSQMLSSQAKTLRSFLDQFTKPVFLVNPEGIIVTGNNAGLSLLEKKPEEVEGELGGDAFGCRYADLPGGCGNTVHCKTCTIRLTVSDTMESGKSNIKIPAYPDLHHITGERRIRFLITTERIGEAVLLRIDDVAELKRAQQG